MTAQSVQNNSAVHQVSDVPAQASRSPKRKEYSSYVKRLTQILTIHGSQKNENDLSYSLYKKGRKILRLQSPTSESLKPYVDNIKQALRDPLNGSSMLEIAWQYQLLALNEGTLNKYAANLWLLGKPPITPVYHAFANEMIIWVNAFDTPHEMPAIQKSTRVWSITIRLKGTPKAAPSEDRFMTLNKLNEREEAQQKEAKQENKAQLKKAKQEVKEFENLYVNAVEVRAALRERKLLQKENAILKQGIDEREEEYEQERVRNHQREVQHTRELRRSIKSTKHEFQTAIKVTRSAHTETKAMLTNTQGKLVDTSKKVCNLQSEVHTLQGEVASLQSYAAYLNQKVDEANDYFIKF